MWGIIFLIFAIIFGIATVIIVNSCYHFGQQTGTGYIGIFLLTLIGAVISFVATTVFSLLSYFKW